MDWKTMESAPRDGTPVLLYVTRRQDPRAFPKVRGIEVSDVVVGYWSPSDFEKFGGTSGWREWQASAVSRDIEGREHEHDLGCLNLSHDFPEYECHDDEPDYYEEQMMVIAALWCPIPSLPADAPGLGLLGLRRGFHGCIASGC